jgi:hypothetical protein
MTSLSTYDRFRDALEHLIKACTLLNQVTKTPVIRGTSASREIEDSITIMTEQYGLLESLIYEMESLLDEEHLPDEDESF